MTVDIGNTSGGSFGVTNSAKERVIQRLDSMTGDGWTVLDQAFLYADAHPGYAGCAAKFDNDSLVLPNQIASNNVVGAGSGGGILAPGGST